MSEESIKLKVFEQADKLLVHQQEIQKGTELKVGRNPEHSDLKKVRLADPRISQRHFSLAFDGDTIRLTDLNSSNGIYIDGKLFKNECVEINLDTQPSKSLKFFAGNPNNSKYEFILVWSEEASDSPSAPVTIESHPEGTVVDDDDDDTLFGFTEDFEPADLTADSVLDAVDDLSETPDSEKATKVGRDKTKEEPPKSDSN